MVLVLLPLTAGGMRVGKLQFAACIALFFWPNVNGIFLEPANV